MDNGLLIPGYQSAHTVICFLADSLISQWIYKLHAVSRVTHTKTTSLEGRFLSRKSVSHTCTAWSIFLHLTGVPFAVYFVWVYYVKVCMFDRLKSIMVLFVENVYIGIDSNLNSG